MVLINHFIIGKIRAGGLSSQMDDNMVAFTGTQRRKAGRIVHIADFIDALKHKGNKRAQIRTAGGKGNFGYDGDKQRGTANFRL